MFIDLPKLDIFLNVVNAFCTEKCCPVALEEPAFGSRVFTKKIIPYMIMVITYSGPPPNLLWVPFIFPQTIEK